MNISVIIPTLNEGAGVAAAITHARRTAVPFAIEVIVCDGGSQDDTCTRARPVADKVLTSAVGRSRQMHAGALAATGDLLVFLHADTRLPDGWAAIVKEAWARSSAPVAAAFALGFDQDGFFYRMITVTAGWRQRLTGVPQGDQAIVVSKAAYFAVGGFPDVPLLEEYGLIRKLKGMGRIVRLPARVLTSARRYEKNGRLWNNLRNTIIVALYYCGVSEERLACLYR